MATFSWVPVPFDHAFRFSQGWSKYGAYQFGQQAPPDWYWDPNPGEWLNLPTSLNDVQDKGWPAVDVPQFGTPNYDTIYTQWAGLPRDESNNAYWDPRRKKWLRVTRRTAPSKQPEDDPTVLAWRAHRADAIRAAKATIFNLRTRQYITADTQRTVEDLLNKELAL